jgi:Fe-S-cluster containining protein
MIVPLSRPHAARSGLPVVDRVDTRIYGERYFAACMECDFCYDSCCCNTAEVEAPVVEQILAHAAGLEAAGVPPGRWFEEGFQECDDHPGGRFTVTRVMDGACVFLNRRGRGCLLHRYALEQGLDVRTIKPLACTAFPVWFSDGLLHPQPMIDDRSLVCLALGPTLYRSARGDLAYYFGADLVAELDALEIRVAAGNSKEEVARTFPLPLLAEPRE